MNTLTLKWLFFVVLSSALVACGSGTSAHKKHEKKTYEVKYEALHKTLYFTGSLQPLQEKALASPMTAVVDKMNYHFGQTVKKGQVVFILNSSELQKQYNDVLTEYLKAKDSYTISRAKFIGTEDLWNAGLLSKNNFLSEKSSLNTTRITLMQSTHQLTEMLKKMGEGEHQDFSSLSFADFDKVRVALSGEHHLILLKAPTDGVLLYPPKANDDKSERINVGSPAKADQVLGLIGDLSGVRVEISVPEVDIAKIHPGMPAIVRGVAFAKHELKGQLVAVNAQASTGINGALPSFTAVVEVKGLDAKAQSWIKVGMSASIEVTVNSSDKLLVPIAAVKIKDGHSVVNVLEKKGVSRSHVVITGAAYDDKVVIDSGLKAGDVVIYE